VVAEAVVVVLLVVLVEQVVLVVVVDLGEMMEIQLLQVILEEMVSAAAEEVLDMVLMGMV
tara:strand:+ start:368 stop:547 length:180 start_codon:yes stop_codon:yes gene_type:complete